MSFLGRLSLSLCAAACAATLTGCSPTGQGQLDEEKEPHFVLGKSRVNAMDYSGAVEAFQESLEVNPRSAAAHFQLACLYDTKETDPAAAVYHYQEYLRLEPAADNAEIIQQRIYSCKQQLAADVLPLPSAPAAQKQLEDLAEKNRSLQDEVDKWRAYYAAQQAAAKTNPPTIQNLAVTQPQTGNPMPDDHPTPSGSAPAKPAKPRTHTVAAGETLAGIARKTGVSLAALQAANPGINPKKMPVGQTVNIPSP